MTDQYGRTITMTTVNGQDVYSWTDGTVSFPSGTDPNKALAAINGMAPANYVPPSVPLNQQFTPSQYGQSLIDEVTAFNAARGLTDAQITSFAQTFQTQALLLQAGALQTVLDGLPAITIDGVLVTSALISILTTSLTAYLVGN